MIDDRFNRIEAFVKGQLDPDEMQSFQKEIESDQELALEVELHRLEWEAMHQLRENDLRAKFKAWKEDSSETGPESPADEPKVVPLKDRTKSRFSLRRYAAAASILLILGLGGFYIKSSQYTQQALFDDHYDAPVVDSGLKGTGTAAGLYDRGLAAYNTQNFKSAIDLLQQVGKDAPDYERAQLFTGHAHFQMAVTGQQSEAFDRATRQYRQIINTGQNHDLVNQAEWYLLMVQLKQEQVDQSFIATLETMAGNEDHNYRNKARQLLNRMKSFWYQWRN